MNYSIFICYRSRDTDNDSQVVYEGLIEYFGTDNVFRAPERMRDAADFEEESISHARSADIILAFIGHQWEQGLKEEGDVVAKELRAGLGEGVPMFPILVRGKNSFDRDHLPDDLIPITKKRGFDLRTGLGAGQETRDEIKRLSRRIVGIVPDLGELAPRLVGGRWPVLIDEGPHPAWAPETSESAHVFGRDRLDRIDQWEEDLLRGDLRLLAIYGEGGIGKSTVAEALWRRLKTHAHAEDRLFDVAVWFSFRLQPETATTLVSSIFEKVPDEFSEEGDPLKRMRRLVEEKRCLIVIDNLETTMNPDRRFADAYSDFVDLLDILKSPRGKGATILTSREVPLILKENRWVKLKHLGSLHPKIAVKVIERDYPELVDPQNQETWMAISERLGGNPYLCILVAQFIIENFDSDPKAWLADPSVPDTVSDIYQWHWDQFKESDQTGALEREVLIWLTLNRQPTSRDELHADLWSPTSKENLENSLDRLGNRFPVEVTSDPSTGDRLLTIHSYILEYSAARIVDLSRDELGLKRRVSENLSSIVRKQLIAEASEQLLMSLDEFKAVVEAALDHGGPTGLILIDHALVKASAEARIRRLQKDAFLVPIVQQLRVRGERWAKRRLHLLLNECGQNQWPGYLAGNLLNLLRELTDGRIEGVQAPGARIRQADFRGIKIHDTNLRKSALKDVRITQSIGQVRALAMSPDGEHLAVGDDAGAVTVWRVGDASPEQSHTLHGEDATVRAVAFNLDGTLLASACNKGKILIWRSWWKHNDDVSGVEVERGTIKDLHETSQLRALAFEHDGRLVSASESPKLWLHDLSNHTSQMIFSLNETEESATEKSSRRINTLSYDKMRRSVFAGTKNGRTYEIPLGTDESFREIKSDKGRSHAGQVWAVTVSPDGDLLATGGADGYVRVWSLPSHRLLFEDHHGGEVFSLAFTHDGERLISGNEDTRSGSTDASVAIYNTVSQMRERLLVQSGDLEGHTLRVRAAVAGETPVGRIFATGGFDRRLILWSETGERLSIVEGYANGFMGVAIGKEDVLYGGYEDGKVLAWDGGETPSEPVDLYRHDGPVFCIATDTARRKLVTGGRDGTVRVADLGRPSRPRILGKHKHWVWSVDISPDGQQVASCSEDNRVLLWDLADGKATTCSAFDSGDSSSNSHSHTDRVRIVRYHPDADVDLLASGGYDHAVRFWRGSDGKPVGALHGAHDWVYALDFSPDGYIAVAWGEGKIRVWSVEQLIKHEGAWSEVEFEEWQASPSEKRILSLLFLSDGRLLSAGEDQTVRIWSRQESTWEAPGEEYNFELHDAAIHALASFPDGRVASGDASRVGWVWHPENGVGTEPSSFAPTLPYEGLDLTGARRETSDGWEDLTDGEIETLESLGASVLA